MNRLIVSATVACGMLALNGWAQGGSSRESEHITKEVRHELVMLPYYGVFDNLAYRVDGNNVTLFAKSLAPR